MRWLVAVAAGLNGSGTARITFNMAERAAVPSPRSSCAPPVVRTDNAPCTEYDVRALLSHIVGGLNRIALVGEGADALAVPARADGVPDDGWRAACQAARARATAAWADDAKLDALVEVPWGKVPGRIALSGYVQEILTHGWDLARATGQPTELDPELASWVLAVAQRILPPEPRGGEIPFGPVIPVPPDAAPYAQLAAWLGRQP
jgi:uncharacterized protein (TIGR03086 family)